MYRTSPLPKPRRSPRTAAALVAGIALAAVTLLAGPATAAAAQRTAPDASASHSVSHSVSYPVSHSASAGAHEHVTRLICTELAEVIGHLPPDSVPARLCKLVNGWD
ncbi:MULTISPECIES: hypothetical protein [unclassified Streptomyces]|uniref:hypothetical protein n=1 Tax=unclassified Streptomyces TaxID=2593676 RepID=UPI00345087B3